MDRADILNEVDRAFRAVLRSPKFDSINESMRLKDLADNLDSITVVEFSMILEEKFQIRIPDESFSVETNTVGDVVDFVEAKIHHQG